MSGESGSDHDRCDMCYGALAPLGRKTGPLGADGGLAGPGDGAGDGSAGANGELVGADGVAGDDGPLGLNDGPPPPPAGLCDGPDDGPLGDPANGSLDGRLLRRATFAAC